MPKSLFSLHAVAWCHWLPCSSNSRCGTKYGILDAKIVSLDRSQAVSYEIGSCDRFPNAGQKTQKQEQSQDTIIGDVKPDYKVCQMEVVQAMWDQTNRHTGQKFFRPCEIRPCKFRTQNMQNGARSKLNHHRNTADSRQGDSATGPQESRTAKSS